MNRLTALSLLTTAVLLAGSADATLTRWTSNCTACHSDDTSTCDGCHTHGNRSLSASSDKDSYRPGELIEIELRGGSRGGWVRSVLYDDTSTEVDRTTGPTGTGNNGGFELELPTTLFAEAPAATGSHTYEATYFGSTGGSNHTESGRNVQIQVAGQRSPIQVEMEPQGTPIYIDGGGGTITYTGSLHNEGDQTVQCVVFAEVLLPSGGTHGPVYGPVTVTLPAGASGGLQINGNVPAVAPTGVYTYYAVVEINGTEVDRTAFRFVKNP